MVLWFKKTHNRTSYYHCTPEITTWGGIIKLPSTNPPPPTVKNDSPTLPVDKTSDSDTNTNVETAGFDAGAGTADSSDAATVVEIVIIAGFFCPWAFIVAGVGAVVVIVSSIPLIQVYC